MRQARLDEKKPEEQPKDSLGILDLETGGIHRVARVKSFKMPEEAGGWVAYLHEKPLAGRDTTAGSDGTATQEPETPEEGEKDDEKKKEEGTELVLRNLATGAETRFADVVDYHFSEDGRWLVYTASNEAGDADGIFTVETPAGAVTPLMTGPGAYRQLALDEAGTRVAFVSNRDDYGAEQPAFTLYHARLGDTTASALAQEGHAALPDGWWVSEHGKVSFSKNGTRLFFGTAPRPAPEPDDDVLDDEKVKVDVWSWTDPLLQPMQLARLEEERKRSYLAVVHLDRGDVVQLATVDHPEVTVGGEGNADVAVANTPVPYRQEISWDYPPYHDVYLIDVATGEHRRVLEKIQGQAELSPASRYITWWDRDALAWFAMPTSGGERVDLTSALPHPVHNERHDWPYKPDPYGTAGWTEEDGTLLVYDAYDVWAVDPAGTRPARNVTDGAGRTEQRRFRYVRLDPEEQAIDPDAPMLLSAFDEQTKAAGFYRDQVRGERPPAELILQDRHFSTPQKAEDAGVLLFTVESFQDFPDLWTAGLAFEDLQRLSHANPQQDAYRWGTAELIEWTSLDGEPLQGLLYRPEDFDPRRTYPMMVYFYERNADNLHRHRAPLPHRSIVNPTFYVSRGYLFFVPDIPYKVGYPGESAVNAVMPGVTHLIDRGFVDRDRIGVQGHSWGGYQIAYMITQTNLFAAAEAGAPVANMTSAYGGIRWGSGMSRMFQYEQTQSRIGGSLWERPLHYIHNSPLFQAHKVETPLLMMHNDQDDAVPWYQGIEMFVALRRLGKPVWLINYNDEPHGLTKYPNKKDWAVRMQQFFDHYLQGAPAPAWMTEGIPAVEKGYTLGLEVPEPAAPAVPVEAGSH